MSRIKVRNYLRNVGRSAKYGMKNHVIKPAFPAVSEMMDDINSIDIPTPVSAPMSDEKEIFNNITKNIKSDIKAGNLFGSEEGDRRAEEGVFKSLGFDAYDDIINEDGDLILEDDYFDSSPDIFKEGAGTDTSSDNKNFIKDNSVINNIKVETTQDTKQSHMRNFQIEKGLNQRIINTVSVLSNQISDLVDFNNSKTFDFYRQTTNFYNDTLERMDKMIELNTIPTDSGVDSETRIFDSDGRFNLEAYLKRKTNLLDDDSSDSDPMMDIFKSMSKNPIGLGIEMLVPALMPKHIRKSIDDLNNIIRSVPALLNEKFKEMSFSDNMISSAIGSIFSVRENNRYSKRKTMSEYRKGRINFDGHTKKAITDIIPGLLSKILSEVSDSGEEWIPDYRTGQLVSKKEVQRVNKMEQDYYIDREFRKQKNYLQDTLIDIVDESEIPDMLEESRKIFSLISKDNFFKGLTDEHKDTLRKEGIDDTLLSAFDSTFEDKTDQFNLIGAMNSYKQRMVNTDRRNMETLNPVMGLETYRTDPFRTAIKPSTKIKDGIYDRVMYNREVKEREKNVIDDVNKTILNLISDPTETISELTGSIWSSFRTSTIGEYLFGEKAKMEKDNHYVAQKFLEEGIEKENSIAVKDIRLTDEIKGHREEDQELKKGLFERMNEGFKEFVIGKDYEEISKEEKMLKIFSKKLDIHAISPFKKFLIGDIEDLNEDSSFLDIMSAKFDRGIIFPLKELMIGTDDDLQDVDIEDNFMSIAKSRFDKSIISPLQKMIIGEDTDLFDAEDSLIKNIMKRTNESIIKPISNYLFEEDNIFNKDYGEIFRKGKPSFINETIGTLKNFLIGDMDNLTEEDTFVKLLMHRINKSLIQPAHKRLFDEETGLFSVLPKRFKEKSEEFNIFREEKLEPFMKNLIRPYTAELKWQVKQGGKFLLGKTSNLLSAVRKSLSERKEKSPVFQKFKERTGEITDKLFGNAKEGIKKMVMTPLNFVRDTADNLMDTQRSRVESGEASKSDFSYLYKDTDLDSTSKISKTNEEITRHTDSIRSDVRSIVDILMGKRPNVEKMDNATNIFKSGKGSNFEDIAREQEEMDKEEEDKTFRKTVMSGVANVADNTLGMSKFGEGFLKFAKFIPKAIKFIGKFFKNSRIGKFIAGKTSDVFNFIKKSDMFNSLKGLGLKALSGGKEIVSGLGTKALTGAKTIAGGLGTTGMLAGGLGLHDFVKSGQRGETGLQRIGSTIIGNAGETFGSSLHNATKQAIKLGLTGMKLGGVFPGIGNLIGGISGALLGFGAGLFGSDPRQGMENLKEGFGFLGKGIKKITSTILSPFKKMGEFLLKPFIFIKDKVTGFIKGAVNILNKIPFVNIKLDGEGEFLDSDERQEAMSRVKKDKGLNTLDGLVDSTLEDTDESGKSGRYYLSRRREDEESDAYGLSDSSFEASGRHYMLDDIGNLMKIKDREHQDSLYERKLRITELEESQQFRKKSFETIMDKWRVDKEVDDKKHKEEVEERKTIFEKFKESLVGEDGRGGLLGKLVSGLSGMFSGGFGGGGVQGEAAGMGNTGDIAGNDNAHKAWNFFKGKGLSDAATAGILGNLQQESGLDPTRRQSGGGPGRGIMQWSEGERWAELEREAKQQGRDPWAIETQLDFMWKEMSDPSNYGTHLLNKNYGGMDKFSKATDAGWATEAFEKSYERAGKPMMARRKQYSESFLNKFSGTSGGASSPSSGAPSGSVGAMSSAAASGPRGQVFNPFQDWRVTSKFGPRNTGIPGASRYHKGVDFGKPSGTPIPAVTSGVISKNYHHRATGNTIEFQGDNGFVYKHAHMVERSPLKVGQRINPGDIIGKVGSTGISSGPHLHFEVIQNGQNIDPLPHLEGMPGVSANMAGMPGPGSPGFNLMEEEPDPLYTAEELMGKMTGMSNTGAIYNPKTSSHLSSGLELFEPDKDDKAEVSKKKTLGDILSGKSDSKSESKPSKAKPSTSTPSKADFKTPSTAKDTAKGEIMKKESEGAKDKRESSLLSKAVDHLLDIRESNRGILDKVTDGLLVKKGEEGLDEAEIVEIDDEEAEKQLSEQMKTPEEMARELLLQKDSSGNLRFLKDNTIKIAMGN